jgi:hypothetical protein
VIGLSLTVALLPPVPERCPPHALPPAVGYIRRQVTPMLDAQQRTEVGPKDLAS